MPTKSITVSGLSVRCSANGAPRPADGSVERGSHRARRARYTSLQARRGSAAGPAAAPVKVGGIAVEVAADPLRHVQFRRRAPPRGGAFARNTTALNR
jgi:hypothetical protein